MLFGIEREEEESEERVLVKEKRPVRPFPAGTGVVSFLRFSRTPIFC